MMTMVSLRGYGWEADILPERGANLIRLDQPNQGIRLLRTPTGMASFDENEFLWGMPILFFPNRISGAAFTFEDRTYAFPMNEPDIGNHCHGRLHATPFEIVDATSTEATFCYKATQDKPYMTFPHTFSVTVHICLTPAGLVHEIFIKNTSSANMPVALGFHTTFRIPFVEGSNATETTLTLPVSREILRDMRTYLPTGEIKDDFIGQGEMLQGTFIPSCHTISRHFRRIPGKEAILKDERTGISMQYVPDPSFQYWMLYNGGNTDFLCVEPQTWVNNCPNAPFPREVTGFSFLQPQEERCYTTKIQIA